MSPLWRDEIGIYLAPRKIVLMRMGRGLKPRVLAETGMTFDEGDFGTWASTLGGLAKSLDGAMWQRANVGAGENLGFIH